MIRRIRLKGFMSHADTTLELAPCLTVITGPNNCGKSAIVEALQCVCGNARGDYMVRHGEKETTVTLETDDGHTVEWRRIKGTPSFVLDGEEIYRTVPEDLHRLLRLPRVPAKEGNDEFDVHFGEQKKPIFLLNDSGGRAATFFASSSDAQYLVKMQDLHRQRTKEAKDEARRLRSDLEELDRELEPLSRLDDIAPKLEKLESEYRELIERQKAEEALAAMIDRLQSLSHGVQLGSVRQQAFAGLANPPEQLAAAALAGACRGLAELATRRATADHVRAAYAPLNPTPEIHPVSELSEAMDRVSEYRRKQQTLSRHVATLHTLTPPPDQQDVPALKTTIRDQGKATRDVERAARNHAALSALPEPPMPHDLRALTTAVSALQSTHTAAEKADVYALGLSALNESLKEQVHRWAAENPVCPTCGEPVNPESLVRELEAAHA